MPTRNVVLTDHQAALVERLVESGRYQNASEVLREGLRLVERREAEDEAKLRALRAAVQVGIDDMEAGRYTTLETPEQIDEHISRLTERALRRRNAKTA
jgi:antitoxin ParD1/3/4